MRVVATLVFAVIAVLGALWVGQYRTQAAADRTLEWRAKAETDAWLRYLSGNGVDVLSLVGNQPLPPETQRLIDAYVPSTDVFMFHLYDLNGVLKGQFTSKGREHERIHDIFSHAHDDEPEGPASEAHSDHSNHADVASDHVHEHEQDSSTETNLLAIKVAQEGRPQLTFSEVTLQAGEVLSFVEGYFPIIRNGETIAVIETYIDITATKTAVSDLFEGLALEVGALAAISLLIPLLFLAQFSIALSNTNRATEAARKAAERAEAAKANFLANMSHEIRTPMNGVVATIDMLERSDLPPDQTALVDTLSKSSASLLDIINDILDFSKIEADAVELRQTEFDPVDLVESAVALFAPAAHAKGLRLDLDCDLDPLIWVCGDPGKLRQCLLNLIGNAVKFTDEGTVAVRLRFDAQDRLNITVTDTGIGIPQDKLDGVFDAFAQADTGASRSHEGTGLGLAITRRLLEQMDGTIRATSCAGGTEFRINLPLPTAPASQKAQQFWSATRKALGKQTIGFGDMPTELAASLRSLATSVGAQTIDPSSGAEGTADIQISYRPSPDGQATGRLSMTCHATGRSGELVPPWQRAAFAEALLDLIGASEASFTPTDSDETVIDTPRLEGQTVLIVEDNKTNQFVLKQMMVPTAAAMITAENGALGFDSFKSKSPNLVFMDMSMPVMDGVMATREIRNWEGKQGRRPTPIIALTANAQPSDEAKCREAGMTGFLAKPLKKKDLYAAIAEALSSAQDEDHPRLAS